MAKNRVIFFISDAVHILDLAGPELGPVQEGGDPLFLFRLHRSLYPGQSGHP
jgi:hypothetical protein